MTLYFFSSGSYLHVGYRLCFWDRILYREGRFRLYRAEIRHHSSLRVKTCYVLRIRNRDFSTLIPHVGLKICCLR